MAAGQPGQVVEAEVVLLRSGRAPVRLQQADHVGAHVAPEALFRRLGRDVGVEVLVGVGVRHRQVAGQQVEQRRDVSGPLDRRVPAQRQDAPARPADVAQQQLQDRRGADVLHPHGVLRPADAVDERTGPFGSGVIGHQLADLAESIRRNPADLPDHLRGIPGEVPF